VDRRIRAGRDVLLSVQPHEHRRVGEHGQREHAEIAPRLGTQSLILPEHQGGIPDLADSGASNSSGAAAPQSSTGVSAPRPVRPTRTVGRDGKP